MDRDGSEQTIRNSFFTFVQQQTAAGARLFDFGAGTGRDAARYAQSGYHVVAYDNSTGMLAQLAKRCEKELAAGSIRAVTGDYEEFLARSDLDAIADAVVANFAVLDLIEDPAALFAKFCRLLRSGGKVVLSVNNPWHWYDLRYSWFWSNLPRLIRHGEASVSSHGPDPRRRSLKRMDHLASPWFIRVSMGPRLNKYWFLAYEIKD